ALHRLHEQVRSCGMPDVNARYAGREDRCVQALTYLRRIVSRTHRVQLLARHQDDKSMSRHQRFDDCRRAFLSAAGTIACAALLKPLRAFAQTSGAEKLRIGVIGSGHIGGTIGGLWVKSGHPVLFSSRHPEELKELVTGLGPLARNGTV